jgi:hypothetical protein
LGYPSLFLSASTCQVITISTYSILCDLSSCHKYAVNANEKVTSLVKFISGMKLIDTTLGFFFVAFSV